MKTPADNGQIWCQTTESPAGADAFHVRLALNPERTKTNPKGGGPKAGWYPARDGWYALSSIAGDLAKDDLPAGVYCLSYADANKTALPEEGRATLRYEEAAEGGPGAAAKTAAGEPKLAQQHLDDLHKVGLKARELDLYGAETSAQTARLALDLAHRILTEQAAAGSSATAAIKVSQDVNLGQAEAAGKLLQFAHLTIEEATKLRLGAQGPPLAQIVRAIGAELRGALHEAGALYLLRQGKSLPGTEAGGQLGPAGGDPAIEIVRLRAENEALKELARLRAENEALKKNQAAPPTNPDPPSEKQPEILDAEVVPQGTAPHE